MTDRDGLTSRTVTLPLLLDIYTGPALHMIPHVHHVRVSDEIMDGIAAALALPRDMCGYEDGEGGWILSSPSARWLGYWHPATLKIYGRDRQ